VVGVAALLVVRACSSESGGGSVETSRNPDYPTRGPLAGDQELLDSALDAWRDDADSGGDAPEGDVEVLWAGPFAPLDKPGRLVVLADGSTVASVVLYGRGDDVRSNVGKARKVDTSGPTIQVTPNLYLLSSEWPERLDVLTPEKARDDPSEPYRSKAHIVDGLVSLDASQALVPGVPGELGKEGVNFLIGPDLYAAREGRWSALRGALIAPQSGPTALAALQAARSTVERGGGGGGGRNVDVEADLLWRGRLPGGDPATAVSLSTIDLDAISLGSPALASTEGAGAALLTGDGKDALLNTDADRPVSESYRPSGESELGAEWVYPPGRKHAWLVMAGTPDVKQLRVLVGARQLSLPGPVSVLEPADLPELRAAEPGKDGEGRPPPLSVSGVTRDGRVIPAD
jgi:hypothetical protein